MSVKCEDCQQTDLLVWSGVVARSLGVPSAAGRLCLLCTQVLRVVNKIDKVIAQSDAGLITKSEEQLEITLLRAELSMLLANYDNMGSAA